MRFLEHSIVYLLILAVALGVHALPEVTTGPFRFVTNPGFIFGTFAEASAIVRIAVTGLFLGPLALLALYFYSHLATELKGLRWGMTLLFAGILSNGLEKMIFGEVIDYGRIELGILREFSFNLSDITQLFGLGIIVWSLFAYQDVIWFPSVRRRILVYPEIQIPVLFRILLGVVIGVGSQLLLTVLLIFPKAEGLDLETILVFLGASLGLTLILLLILGRFILRELLRFLGPVSSIERYLREGDPRIPLKIRRSHHFIALEELFNEFVRKIRSS